MFDATFNWGTILTILFSATGVMGFLWSIRTDLSVLVERMKHFDDSVSALASRVGQFEAQLSKISETLVAVARQDERLNALESRVNELVTARAPSKRRA